MEQSSTVGVRYSTVLYDTDDYSSYRTVQYGTEQVRDYEYSYFILRLQLYLYSTRTGTVLYGTTRTVLVHFFYKIWKSRNVLFQKRTLPRTRTSILWVLIWSMELWMRSAVLVRVRSIYSRPLVHQHETNYSTVLYTFICRLPGY